VGGCGWVWPGGCGCGCRKGARNVHRAAQPSRSNPAAEKDVGMQGRRSAVGARTLTRPPVATTSSPPPSTHRAAAVMASDRCSVSPPRGTAPSPTPSPCTIFPVDSRYRYLQVAEVTADSHPDSRLQCVCVEAQPRHNSEGSCGGGKCVRAAERATGTIAPPPAGTRSGGTRRTHRRGGKPATLPESPWQWRAHTRAHTTASGAQEASPHGSCRGIG
jgi:hypothetical protein